MPSERMKNGSDGNAPNPNPNPNHPPPSGNESVFDEVDAALRKIPGIENHSVFSAPVIAPILALIDKGYNFKTQIVPSIKAQVAGSKPGRIKSWGYFVSGIIEANGKSVDIPPAVENDKWEERLAIARRRSLWDVKWGPLPGQAGCSVPSALLKTDDGQGWTEWKAA